MFHTKCLTNYIHQGNLECILCGENLIIKPPEPEEIILNDNVGSSIVDNEMALDTEASDNMSL